MYKIIREYLKDKKTSLAFIFSMQIVAAILSMVMPYYNGKLIDILTSSTTIQEIIKFIMLIAALTLSSIVLGYIVKVIITKTKNNISYEMTLNVWNHLSKVPVEKINRYDSSYLNQRIKGDCDSIISFWIDNIFSIVVNLASIIVILLILIRTNMTLFLIAVLFIPIYCIVYLKMKKPLYKKGKQARESGNIYYSSLNGMYMRIKEIKTTVSYDYEQNKINSIYESYFKDLISYTKLSYLFNASDSLISWAFQSMVFLIGGAHVISNRMTIGQFTMMNTYFNMILSQVKSYFEIGQSYQSVLVSMDRVQELYNIEKEAWGNKILQSISKVEICEANYVYNTCKVFLRDVNYDITKPGIYAFVGRNGTGKTTLVNAIIGVNYLGTKGNIAMNGYALTELDMYSLRKNNMSIMLQNQKLPNITVSEYIIMNASEEKFKELETDSAIAKTFSSELFNIYLLLDKKLDMLSTGQKQMVILFTTLIKPADIYFLDEPTSNIHMNLVDKVIDLLNEIKKNKIIIIISHDNKFITIYDGVYTLD